MSHRQVYVAVAAGRLDFVRCLLAPLLVAAQHVQRGSTGSQGLLRGGGGCGMSRRQGGLSEAGTGELMVGVSGWLGGTAHAVRLLAWQLLRAHLGGLQAQTSICACDYDVASSEAVLHAAVRAGDRQRHSCKWVRNSSVTKAGPVGHSHKSTHHQKTVALLCTPTCYQSPWPPARSLLW